MYLSDYTDKRILEREGQILQIPSFMLEFGKRRKNMLLQLANPEFYVYRARRYSLTTRRRNI